MLGILYSVLMNGMVRPPNDGVHLETPQAQTLEALLAVTPSRDLQHTVAFCGKLRKYDPIYSEGP